MVHFPKNEIHFYEVGNQPNPQRAKSCANAVLDEHLAPPSCSLEERSKIREEESLPAGMNSSSHFSRISQRVKFLNPFSTHSAIKTSLSVRQVLIPWGGSSGRIASMARILSASLDISAEVISNVQPKVSPPSNGDSFSKSSTGVSKNFAAFFKGNAFNMLAALRSFFINCSHSCGVLTMDWAYTFSLLNTFSSSRE